MGEIVNLRRVKKTRARAEQAAQAEANRALHGTPQAVRRAARAEQARAANKLEGARILPPSDAEPE